MALGWIGPFLESPKKALAGHPPALTSSSCIEPQMRKKYLVLLNCTSFSITGKKNNLSLLPIIHHVSVAKKSKPGDPSKEPRRAENNGTIKPVFLTQPASDGHVCGCR